MNFRLLATFALVCLTCCSRSEERKNVVLVSVDTLRADHLSCYGGEVPATPHFDRIAKEGVLFERVSTVAPMTLPAHATLLTGASPLKHLVHDNAGFRLREDIPTLASTLKGAGYRTGGFVGSFVLDRRFGLARGFDLYSDEMPDPAGGGLPERRGEEVLGAATRWMSAESDQPFFAFLHFFDPHRPYAPPAPFDPGGGDEASRYRAEVLYVDSLIGRLLDWLDEADLADRTLLVVTADHGESLGEHGEDTHGFFVYESTIRVPLLVRGPNLPAGRRVGHLVRLLDVTPTVLELVGVDRPKEIDGVGLFSPGGDVRALDLEAYAEAFVPRLYYGWSELQSWRRGGLKFIRAPRSELYDLDADPAETRNLIEESPEVALGLRREIERATRGMSVDPEPVDERTRASLRALGYLGGAQREPPSSERVDPKDRVPIYNEILALSLVSRPGLAELARVEAVLESEPRSPRALGIYGRFLLELGRARDAERAYRRLLDAQPDGFDGHYGLGRALMALDENDAARASLEKAREVDSENAGVYVTLAALSKEEGNSKAAEENLRRALALAPDRRLYQQLADLLMAEGRGEELSRVASEWRGPGAEAASLYARGQLLASRGDDAGALLVLERAFALAPGDDDVEQALANTLSRVGRLEEAMGHYRSILARSPCYLGALTNLGAAHERIGKLDEGIRFYQAAIRCDARYANAYRNLGAALARKGELRRALAILHQARELAPDDRELAAAVAELERMAR
jgi:arylsulfatase A-like enzyme/Flp pilus assembly protein TadD